jgi:Holliday junction resolvase RusA-like endonuclease
MTLLPAGSDIHELFLLALDEISPEVEEDEELDLAELISDAHLWAAFRRLLQKKTSTVPAKEHAKPGETPTIHDRREELGRAIQLAWDLTGEEPIEGPVALKITSYFNRPASMNRKRSPNIRTWDTRKKGDWDNVGKTISDSLNGRAYQDDTQVVCGTSIKVICDEKEEPWTEVIIREVPPMPESMLLAPSQGD